MLIPMHIVLTGATGFLGRPLVRQLAADGHTALLLARSGKTRDGVPPDEQVRTITWTPDDPPGALLQALDGADAVINLAGEPMAGRRWTDAQKRRIRDSRIRTTQVLAATIAGMSNPPATFISGSAIGYYGLLGAEPIDESAPAGDDFVARVCRDWEAAATIARSARTRVVLLRTSLVLHPGGGALQQMLTPFRLGVGGPLGSGRQYWSWIHRQDWIDLVRFLLVSPHADGPVNASAPSPVTNAEFSRALGRVLHRPAFLPAPAFALRLLFGEMADAMLLGGQRVMPVAATALGFVFRHPRLDGALRDLLSTK